VTTTDTDRTVLPDGRRSGTRLRELSCYAVDIPTVQDTYVMSHGRVLTSFPSTVVKVTADDGTVGFGEACTLGSNYLDGFPASAQETVRLLADWTLACDVFDANVLVDGMDTRVVGNLTGKAAIDTAMWDLRGRLLGLPVSQLLGGIKQTRFPWFQAISMGTPDQMAAEAERLAALGCRAFQLKLGDDPLVDAARVHAVAEAAPADVGFVTWDANKGWTVAQTVRFAAAVESLDGYLEQPCATLAELRWVRAVVRRPLMADESLRTTADALELAVAGSVDAINLKPTRVGGLTKAARIRDLAQAAGWMVLPDEPQGADLATAALAHLSATVEPAHLLAVSYFMGADMRFSYQSGPGSRGPGLEGGTVTCSTDPGLGVQVDEATLGEPLFTVHRARR
jgi:cis-L-3-hydroxyproline dehydratase